MALTLRLVKAKQPLRHIATTPAVVGSAPARRLLVVAATIAFAGLLTGGVKLIPFVDQQRCVQLTIASSNEKFAFLNTLAQNYDNPNRELSGQCVNVSVFELDSGYAEADLANLWTTNHTDPRPDVWSPASDAWIYLLETNQTAAGLIPSSYPHLFQSPLVIGMPKDYALQLGYPGTAIGWSDIFQLVNNRAGWKAKGKPEWGPFLLGKTNPSISTSGLHALIESYYAAPNFQLTPQGVSASTTSAFVGGIEKGVIHYGRTAQEFLNELANGPRNPPYYVSAVAIEEEELVVYNQTALVKLTPIYPSDGTIVANHPYALLNWAGNSDQNAKQAVANDFYKYVISQSTAIDSHGFRLNSGTVGTKLAGYLQDRGLMPVQYQSPTTRSIPPGELLKRMLEQWELLRKPARVLIVVDTAVPAPALSNALRDLRAAASAPTGFQMQDEVGVWTFPGDSDPYHELLPLTPAQQQSGTQSSASMLDTALAGIRASPEGAENPVDLPTALLKALGVLKASGDKSAPIEAILLIDMKADQTQPQDDLLSEFKLSSVRVFTVGPQSNDRLATIANDGRGAAYTPETTPDALNDVLSNF